MMYEIDAEEEYNSFWKSVVENNDGTINMEQLKKELADYSLLMKNMSELFCLITGGRISKQNTMAYVIASIYDDELQASYDDGYKNGRNK